MSFYGPVEKGGMSWAKWREIGESEECVCVQGKVWGRSLDRTVIEIHVCVISHHLRLYTYSRWTWLLIALTVRCGGFFAPIDRVLSVGWEVWRTKK